MARSARVSVPVHDELETQGQLSLFAPRKEEGHTEIKDGSGKEGMPGKSASRPSSRLKKQAEYSAADIQVLEGIAPIRRRPGMYIGSTSSSGLLHLLWEALDNAVDEAVAGFGKHIWVTLDREGWLTVR